MSVLDSFRLDGKVAIVTGASSGLGVAFAQAFAEAGADVVLGARRVERMAQTAALVEAAGAPVASVQTDVAMPEQCQGSSTPRWRRSAVSTYWSTTPDWAPRYPPPARRPNSSGQVIDVNLNGSYWMAQACGG